MTLPHAPSRIYLQVGDDAEPPINYSESTWCADRINGSDVEYVRADLATSSVEPTHQDAAPLSKEPMIPGTRIFVRAIREFHEAGYSVEAIISEYPDLTEQQVRDALGAASLSGAQQGEVLRWRTHEEDGAPAPGTECFVWSHEAWEKAPSLKLDRWDELHEAPLAFSSQTICVGEGWQDHDDMETVQRWVPIADVLAALAHPAPLPSHGEDNDGDLSLDWMSDTGIVSLSLRNDGLVFFAWRDAGEGGHGRFNVPPGLVQALRKMPDGDGLLFDGSAPDKHVHPAPSGEDRRDEPTVKCLRCGCEHGIAAAPYWMHNATWSAQAIWTCDRCDGEQFIDLGALGVSRIPDALSMSPPPTSGTSRPFTPEEHAAWERENGVGEAAKGEGERG